MIFFAGVLRVNRSFLLYVPNCLFHDWLEINVKTLKIAPFVIEFMCQLVDSNGRLLKRAAILFNYIPFKI